MRHRSAFLLVGIAYASFVGMGLSSSLLGVAWPSIRSSFGISLDAVGALLVATTVGSLLSSFASGSIVARIGKGPFLIVGSLSAAVGLLGYVLAPTWWVMVLCGLPVGIAGGAMDAGSNAHFSENHGSRLMNWLHACFGIGSILGPIIMTAVLNLWQSWRSAYAVACVLQMLLATLFALTRNQWRGSDAAPSETDGHSPTMSAGAVATLRLPVVLLSALLFFLVIGIEMSAGQWSYSLFAEAWGVAPATAGIWVGIYWGSLTAGRIVYGIVATRLGILSSMRASVLAIICGAALVWWHASDIASFLGLALLGFAIAPLPPLLHVVTPKRVGAQHGANAIGFQTGAGGLGHGVVPALAGRLAESFGLEVIGPFLLAGAFAMLLVHETIASWLARRGQSPGRETQLGT